MDVRETEVPDTDDPETDVSEMEVAETDDPETDIPETEVAETNGADGWRRDSRCALLTFCMVLVAATV